MNPADIVCIASELRLLMLPEIGDLINSQLPNIKVIVLSAVNEATSTLMAEISSPREENASLREINDDLETRIAKTESNNETLEQYTCRNSVRISGFPEQANENTDEIVLRIAEMLEVSLTPSDIDRSYRMGRLAKSNRAATLSANRHRNIIVKFATYNARQKLFLKRKE